MQSLKEKLREYEQEIKTFFASDAKQLEEYRIKYLGTKGVVKQIFGEMKNVPSELKKEAGQMLNSFKQLAERKYEEFVHLQDSGSDKEQAIDITLPGVNL